MYHVWLIVSLEDIPVPDIANYLLNDTAYLKLFLVIYLPYYVSHRIMLC